MIGFLLNHGSYLAIIAVLVLTGAGLPVPEEVPIIAAGILSAHGQLNPWMAAASCLVGAILGDWVMYWIGFHFGRSFLREHPRWARWIHPEREARIEQMIHRHGLKFLFVARFLVGVRSPMYFAVGIMRLPFRRFLLIDLFCATAVVSVFFTLSYYYGTTITGWIREAQVLLTVVVVLAVLGVGIYFWRRHVRRLRAAEADDSSAATVPLERPMGEIERVA